MGDDDDMALPTYNDSPSQEILTQMLMVYFQKILPDYRLFRKSAGIRLYEHATGETVMALKAWLLDGHKSDVRVESREICFPSSPWQFWKQRNAPGWFLRKWPVRTTTTVVEFAEHHHFVCPHLEFPEAHQHYLWMGRMSGQVK